MKRFIIPLPVVFLSFGLTAYSQDPVILTVNQASPLLVNAGPDVKINKGESITIGGNPSASQGYGGYIYSWSPSTGLDNATIANPVATPVTDINYLLTVTDVNNCSANDEISITVDASGIELIPSGLAVRCYPNPAGEELLVELKGIPAEVTLQLRSTIGKELIVRTIHMPGNIAVERISLQDLAAGIYYLKIISSEASYYQTIIKTR